MGTALIIDRISSALSAGELLPVPDASAFRPIVTISDLMRPFSEMFPGIEVDEEGQVDNLFRYGRRSLLRARFIPRPRRSRRPLPPPRRVQSSPKPVVTPILMQSLQAIWEWYGSKGLADVSLLANQADPNGITAFLEPLYAKAIELPWPVSSNLEAIYGEASFSELYRGLWLMLPHYSYEEDGVDVFEAFLSGPESVASILEHLAENGECTLSTKDRKLIEKHGFTKLTECYATHPGKKTYDLDKLQDWFEIYFSEVDRKFPEQKAGEFAVISGNGGQDAEICIRSAADLDFVWAYSDAYCAMTDAMPDCYDFSTNDGGIADRLITEICKVWRKADHTPPRIPTLAERYERGEL